MSRINFVPLIKQEGLQNAIVRNKKEPSPLIGYAKRIETYDDIVSLPSNANGQISVTLYGLTVTQLIKNGNFANGLANWSGATLFTIEDGMLKINTVNPFTVWQNMNIIAGHKYYISFYAISDGQADLTVMLRNEGTIISGIVGSQKSTTYTRYSGVVVATQNGDRLTINRGTSPPGDAYAKIDNIMLIDLTAHGLENKTVAELDAMFPVYFEGTKSTVCGFRIRSVSQDESQESTAYVLAKDAEGKILELRSLPNGVKDEFRVSEGKLIQRIGHKENVASGTVINYADMADGGQFVAYYADGMQQIGVKGDTLTADAVQLNYQLASPVISKVDVFGDLKAFPGGTIYFEPTLWGFINFDYGQNSKVITTPDVPIGSIRKVVRYDITDDGRLVATDVTADCTHNGTTLTIANAEPKKTYFYDCEIAPGYYTSAEKIIDVGTHEGVVEHDYGAAAADWVLSTNEALATMLVCKNAGGAAKIIAPAAEGKMYIIRNESGQTITIKTASSTGVTVANGKTATVVFYNTDFIKIGEV